MFYCFFILKHKQPGYAPQARGAFSELWIQQLLFLSQLFFSNYAFFLANSCLLYKINVNDANK